MGLLTITVSQEGCPRVFIVDSDAVKSRSGFTVAVRKRWCNTAQRGWVNGAVQLSRAEGLNPPPAASVSAGGPSVPRTVDEVGEVDEVDKVGEVGEVDKVGEVGEVDEVGEVGEVDEVGEVGEVDEVDEVGEVDEVDEVNEVDKVDKVDEVGEVDEVDEVNEVDEVDKVDEVNEVDEVGEVGEVDEVDEVGEVDEVNEVDEVDKVDEVGEVETWARWTRCLNGASSEGGSSETLGFSRLVEGVDGEVTCGDSTLSKSSGTAVT
ncbi:unnamed protein product [Lampetra fluviatilis]